MLVSVVIPAYNCEKTIEKSLDSVLQQTKYDLVKEIIIVNDGSSDSTDVVIRKYIENHANDLFIYLQHENHGVSYTRNRGIKEAKGDWIALLDSDDLWKPTKLERQFEVIKSNSKIKFIGSVPKLKLIVSEKKGLYKLNARELCIRNMPPVPSIVFHRETGIQLGLFDEKMRYGEDINFFQKFMLLDSYYILVEDLVEIDFNKKFYAQSGLSSNLYQMHLGRNRNTKELFEMNLISRGYKNIMLICNGLKFIRRFIIRKYERWKYRRKKEINNEYL